MAIAYCSGLPVAVHAASASPHEVTLVKETLDAELVAAKPERLIGDRAHDCDPLDAFLHAKDIEMIASQRKGRKNEPTQDGRKLRRYKRRWKVELLFALLGNFRRLRVPYKRRAENYVGFARLGCMVILLRYLRDGCYNISANRGVTAILRFRTSIRPLRWNSLITFETASRVETIMFARS